MDEAEVFNALRELVADVAADRVTVEEFTSRERALLEAIGDATDDDGDLLNVLWSVAPSDWSLIVTLGEDAIARIFTRQAAESSAHVAAAHDRPDDAAFDSPPHDPRWAWVWDIVQDAVSDWAETDRRTHVAGLRFTQRVVELCEADADAWWILEMWLDGDDVETAYRFGDPEVQRRARVAIEESGWHRGGTDLPIHPDLEAASGRRAEARLALQAIGGPGWGFVEEPTSEQLAAEDAYWDAWEAYAAVRERVLDEERRRGR